jgi:hypothetical protein
LNAKFQTVSDFLRFSLVSEYRKNCAHIPPSPAIDIEATSGSLEDYDDRNGYLPDFLGAGSQSNMLKKLEILRNAHDPQGKASGTERKIHHRFLASRRSRRPRVKEGKNAERRSAPSELSHARGTQRSRV